MSDNVVNMSPRRREADGLQIRYAESDGVADETVLLLNPWPESLFAWNTIWSRLAENARLVAIDLPGFGQSERRAELLSPRAMGGFLLRLIDEWELGHPHVVGPTWEPAPCCSLPPRTLTGSPALSWAAAAHRSRSR